jgi:hypothetical protein
MVSYGIWRDSNVTRSLNDKKSLIIGERYKPVVVSECFSLYGGIYAPVKHFFCNHT